MAARTQIDLGALTIDVSLIKTSSEPAAAKWETRTVKADGSPLETHSLSDEINASALPSPSLEQAFAGAAIAAGDTVAADASGAVVPADDPLGDRPDVDAGPAAADPVSVEPATKTIRGVTTDEGVFVDLTERLETIDDECKLEGMEVVAAIGASTIPRERVRDASYVQPADETSRRACAMLYSALAAGQRALAVRWTKRTNQALGIIVASKTHDCLVLLEVEFAAHMKDAPAKARLDAVSLTLTDDEIAAADRFIGSIAGRRSDLDDVVDERRTRHAELLDATREGKLAEYDDAHLADSELEVLGDVDAEFAALVGAQA